MQDTIDCEHLAYFEQKKFGVQNCLDKIVGGRYVLGSDGDFEFKLKYVLSHLEKMPQTALDEILEFFTRSYDAGKKIMHTKNDLRKTLLKNQPHHEICTINLIWTVLSFFSVSFILPPFKPFLDDIFDPKMKYV